MIDLYDSNNNYEFEKDLFFSKSDKNKTLENLRAKIYTNPSFYASSNDMINYEKVLNFFVDNLDFVVVNQPVFQLAYISPRNENNAIKSFDFETKTVSCMSMISNNYINIYHNIRQELEKEENKGKTFILYAIQISSKPFEYGDPIMDQYNSTYNIMVRGIIEDIGYHNHLIEDYKKIQKRKDIAEHYNNKKAIRFSEYVKMERQRIADEEAEKQKNKRIGIGRIPTFESFMANVRTIKE